MKRFLVLISMVLAGLVLLPQAGSAAPKSGENLTGLYNQRYCEIFLVSVPRAPVFTVDIYNTVGLNDCPRKAWNGLDFDQIKTDTGSIAVAPNGPRRWLIDTIAGGEAGEPTSLGGLEMRFVATLDVPSLQPPPYTEMKIARTTTWVFNKGRKIHFLISPKGRKYALQAYTTTIAKKLRAKNLKWMDKRPKMALPEGWNYKTIKLKKQLRLKAPGMATILRDPLAGTYQKFKWPKNFFKPAKKKQKPKVKKRR